MKILVLLSRFPYPLDKGDKLRAYYQLRYLAGQGHEICLLALSDEAVSAEALAAVQPLCRGGLHVHRLGRAARGQGLARALATAGRPLQVGYFYEKSAQRLVDKLLAAFRPDHVYCQLIRMAEYLRPHAGQVPATLDYMDVFSAGMARRAATAPAWQRPVLALEARRLAAYEAAAFRWFRGHTIISEQDRGLISHTEKEAITIVPNGIALDYFQPQPLAPKTHDLLFCGNMGYHPNVDAACWLAEEIVPLVQQQHPGASLLVAGTSPAPRVRALASRPGVQVSGWLPDIRTAYAGARVFVAPMRVGTGLQNKLLEAMAMQLPCVTTPLANNALRGTPGHHLLVASEAPALAEALVGLLANQPAAAQLAAAGRTFVAETYDWATATKKLENLFGDNC
ncbi:glycosyltransferase [Hymenobacter ginsengisoli]|uniref:Glycosyltransferase n=1 Tax=Hymenobacter ginsengisoli TaxID=1051626 RepID=A0ABP8Q4P4_9BACT|nr:MULTISPECIES: glycosyltransferase [unclassified Hymenobacter]MBO2031844.1 glycosyltransferase [Hymenobacter sp. BT559]